MANVPAYRTFVQFDEEAHVWVTDASNVPGLVAEADNLHALYKAVEVSAPRLVRDNLYREDKNAPHEVPHEVVVIDGDRVTERKVIPMDVAPPT